MSDDTMPSSCSSRRWSPSTPTIAGDVVEIDAHTWAIHGSIAVDGDVIMAEYESEEHARIVLGELAADEEGRPDPR